MDEERAKALDNVLHEDPLTDLEGDGDHDMSNGYEYEVPLPTSPIPSSPPLKISGTAYFRIIGHRTRA